MVLIPDDHALPVPGLPEPSRWSAEWTSFAPRPRVGLSGLTPGGGVVTLIAEPTDAPLPFVPSSSNEV
jgi:hypothetical protein